jgi:hypothetical protein
MANRWEDIDDEREKYQAYLCSREWSVLKNAVHDRAGGQCERCFTRPIQAVHHLTYARKYREDLRDLQGICNGCHEFIHGKSDVDPCAVEDRPFHVLKVISRDGELYVDCGYYCVELCGSIGISVSKGMCDPKEAERLLLNAIKCGMRMKDDSRNESSVHPEESPPPPPPLVIRRAADARRDRMNNNQQTPEPRTTFVIEYRGETIGGCNGQ